MKKAVATFSLIAALAVPGIASAEDYQYPLCKDDPDVTCYTPAGEEHPKSTYESGQYPTGWYDARYNADGSPNDFRKKELGRPVATPQPDQEDTYVTDVEITPTPVATPEVKPLTEEEIAKQKQLELIQLIEEMLGWDR